VKFALAFFFLIPSFTFADTARIAAWNIGGFYKIPEYKLTNIIEGIKILDADIIVLSELNPASHAKAIADGRLY
jgi:hypothetical protein